MKPLILEFAEQARKIPVELSLLEYSNELNLTVYKSNGNPAIRVMELDTATISETKGIPSDTDMNSSLIHNFKSEDIDLIKSILGTRTITEARGEATDTD